MTLTEFSDEFDVLVLTLTGRVNTFNEYEKSVYLTMALESIVKALYNGNLSLKGFEETEEMRRSLEGLIKTYKTYPELYFNEDAKPTTLEEGNLKSFICALPLDILYITLEKAAYEVDDEDYVYIKVIPCTLDDFHKIKNNPFRGPNKFRALKFDIGESKVELLSIHNIKRYMLRYLSKPEPIILETISPLTIDGYKQANECKLNPVLHRIILEAAVNMAIRNSAVQKTQ